MGKFLCIAAALWSAAPFALADTLPTNTDLKAAYCITILNQRLAVASGTVANTRADQRPKVARILLTPVETNLRRLERYLLPRLADLEVTGIEAAAQSAREDYAAMNQEVAACVAAPPACEIPLDDPIAKDADIKKCLSNPCAANPSQNTLRIRACFDTSWLPY